MELNKNIQGLLLQKIAADVGLRGDTFAQCMQQGFDVIGNMELCFYNEVLFEWLKSFEEDICMAVEERREARAEFNEMIVSRVR